MAELKLLAHQIEGVKQLQARPRMLLADEPGLGLGKTAQLLLAAKEPVLVVAPAMALDSGTWDDEIAKWTPGIDATQVSYSSLCARRPKGRVLKDANGFPIVDLREDLRRHWGSVICDESHYLKGRKTSWTAGVFKLSTDQLHLATGTPIPNWAHEAFTALQLMYPEEAKQGRRFGSYWRWAREWFEVGPTMWAQMAVGDLKNKTDEGWAEFRGENWGDRMLLRLREECLDLPPLIESRWNVKMTPEQRRVYKTLKRDFIAWLDTGEQVEAWSSGGQLVKLMKCATGLEVLDSGAGAKGSGKMDALRTILSDRPFPTLVVAHFRDSVAACARVAVELGMTTKILHGGVTGSGRRDAVRAFQSGSLDVLCASIETVAESMTLHQGGADQIVRVERHPRPSKNEQVMRRLHRMGVEKPISCIDLVTTDSTDERILELLRLKTDQQMRALGTDRRALRELA